MFILKDCIGIGALKRIRPFASPSTTQLIYSCLVQSYFEYSSVFWDSCGSTLAENLQKLQNRAARVLTSSTYDTNADHLFEMLGWKNLASQRKIAKAIMVYKSLNGLAPDCQAEMFVDCSNVTNYKRTDYLKNSFSYSGAVLWNSLPSQLRRRDSYKNFNLIVTISLNNSKYF